MHCVSLYKILILVILVLLCFYYSWLNSCLKKMKLTELYMCGLNCSERSYEISVGYTCKWSVILMVTSVMQCLTLALMVNCHHYICQWMQHSTSSFVACLHTTLVNHWSSFRPSCCRTLKILVLR